MLPQRAVSHDYAARHYRRMLSEERAPQCEVRPLPPRHVTAPSSDTQRRVDLVRLLFVKGARFVPLFYKRRIHAILRVRRVGHLFFRATSQTVILERRLASRRAGARGRRRGSAVLHGGELRLQSPVLPRRLVGFKNVRERCFGTPLPRFGVRATMSGFQFLQALRHKGQLVIARTRRGTDVLPCSVLLRNGLPDVQLFSTLAPVPGTAANFLGRQIKAVLECLFWSKPFDGGSEPPDTRRALCGQVANSFVVWRPDLVGAEDYDLAAPQ